MGSLRRLTLALTVLLTGAAAAPPARPRIVSDARVDLVGLLAALSGDPHSPSNPVCDAAVRRFARWRAHPAVTRLARMREKGFAWDAPAQYAVYLSTPPDLREAHPAPDFFARLAGGKAELDSWRADASDFARVSGFLDWESGRGAEREAELSAVRAAAAGRDLETPLVRYLGVRTWDDWVVIVSPFFPSGGNASWVLEEKPGRPDVMVVFGPYWGTSGFWRPASLSGGEPAHFGRGVWPEAVFSATYALFEVCRPVEKLTPSSCAGMRGLVNAEDCVQQAWVRGIVSRLVEAEYGAEAARDYRAHWSASPYQEKVDAALRAYEKERDAAPDLMSAAGPLLAPFQVDGRAPVCRLIDRARWPEVVYARRLSYYLEGRLEQRPDAELGKALSDVSANGGKGR